MASPTWDGVMAAVDVEAAGWTADEAVTRLFAAHYRPLVRLAALLLADTGTAEEIVQDAYVRLHQRWRGLREPDRALGYLRTSVVNGARSALRHRAVARRYAAGLRPPGDAPSAEAAHLDSAGNAGLVLAAASVTVLLAAGVATQVIDRPADRSGPGPGAGAASATGTAARGANLPVYYLGPARLGDRLYREYQVFPGANPSPEQAVAETVRAMLGRPAGDPDYRSPWPAGATVRSVSVDGATVTIDLGGAAGGAGFDPTVDAPTAAMAVQQLIWTATAAAPGLTGVRLLLDGAPATSLWGKAPASGVLHRGPAADVLAPVWIIDPQQGTVQGTGSPCGWRESSSRRRCGCGYGTGPVPWCTTTLCTCPGERRRRVPRRSSSTCRPAGTPSRGT